MADVLRQLLDSGKLSDENCRSILRGLGKEADVLHVCKAKEADGWSSEEEEEVDEEYRRQVKESLGFDIDDHVRIPASGISPCFLGENDKPLGRTTLYGHLGVHCFNIEKGRKLQFMRIPKVNTQFSLTRYYYITVEVKDLADNSAHTFQTLVIRSLSRNGEHLRVNTQICRLKPETPAEGYVVSLFDEKAIDEFYKGCMPNFLTEAKAEDRLRFYEVQEQDICENDWLRLYTEFARFSIWRFNEDEFESFLPVEIKKIVVETFETHSEPSLKLKSSNAIFHINFSANSCDYRSVVRRTTDGKPGHLLLEISTWFDQA